MAAMAERMTPLGAGAVDVTDVLAIGSPRPAVPKFRLEFTHDVRAREMRWVVFTSSRRGGIGKLVFTVAEAPGSTGQGAEEVERRATAHVKSLSVHQDWRGFGLARILFLACLATLSQMGVDELQLEAEEDTKRHGKLVALYAKWGFHEVPGAKILFLYNQNECFRKVPMALACHALGFAPMTPQRETWFCMLTLTSQDGACLVASPNGAIQALRAAQAAKDSQETQAARDMTTTTTTMTKMSHGDALWQTLLGRNGEIYLRSAHGKFLCVEDSGAVLADRPWHSTWETFQVVPYHPVEEEVDTEVDTKQEKIEDKQEELKVETSASKQSTERKAVGCVALKDFHGRYLSIDPKENKVMSSQVPIPWDGGSEKDGKAGDITSLMCNKLDTTPLHVRVMRKHQTLAFVERQRTKYGRFQQASLSISDAYTALMALTGDSDAPSESWLLHHVLATAEAVRRDGHPDWFQLIVFLRGLGLLFLLWADEDNAVLRNISVNEWMGSVSTWIMGQPIPDKIQHPELNSLNVDHCNASTSSSPLQGSDASASGCTLDSLPLPWTPDEYLFRVLEFNETSLPTEALQAIRYWSLRPWYQQGCYSELTCSPQDTEVKDWLNAVAAYTIAPKERMREVVPETVMPYYLGLADKYLPPVLQW